MSLQKYSEPEDAFNEISVLPEGENMAAVKALEPSTVLPFDENKPLSIDDLSNSGKHPPILYSYTGGINDEQSTI